MYTGNQGVRIGLDSDMFKTYEVITHKNCLFDEPVKDLGDCIALATINKADLCDIEYVDNPKSLVNSIITKVDNEAKVIIGNVGKYKSKIWSFQQESRFKIAVMPTNETLREMVRNSVRVKSNIDANETYVAAMSSMLAWQSNISCKRKHIDMPLKNDVLNNIEVTLAPAISDAKAIIVNSLLNEYSNSIIRRSALKIRDNK